MSKLATLGQGFNLLAVLANYTDWENLDGELLKEMLKKPVELGAQFTAFLRRGARLQVLNQEDVDYGPFENLQEFLEWVSTNHGTDVKQACEVEITAALARGESVIPLQALDNLTRATRQIDVSKSGIRARFVC